MGQWRDNQYALLVRHIFIYSYRFHGAGTLYFPNGQQYSCQYVNGKVASEITIHYPSGDTYVGEVKGITIHGKGTFKSHNGSFVYQGDWKRQKQHGKGVMIVYNQSQEVIERYSGDWVDGKKQGKGSYTSHDGISYEGDWVADQVSPFHVITFISFLSLLSLLS